MNPSSFLLFVPEDLSEAKEILNDHAGEARILAGGMSLIPLMKLRIGHFPEIIDIGRISSLKKVSISDGTLKIGALVTDHEIEGNDIIRKHLPILPIVSRVIGDVQVRNRGTLGGSLCQADPSGDWGPCFLSLDGKAEVESVRGRRLIPSSDFFKDSFETALREDEILTNVYFKIPRGRWGYSYEKLERKAGDFAIAGVSVSLILDEEGSIEDINVGLTGVANKPIRGTVAEELLTGNSPEPRILEKASRELADSLDPPDDKLRGSREYKREIAGVLLKRAVLSALKKAEVN